MEDFENFVTEMKRVNGIYNIKQITSIDGKIASFDYEELKTLPSGARLVKKDDKFFIANYTQVDSLDYLNTSTWRTLRQFRYSHMVNGVEAFYDPENHLFVQITDFC